MTDIPDWQEKSIPLVLHGDGFSFDFKKSSIKSVSFGFMHTDLWGWDSMWLLVVMPKVIKATKKRVGRDVATWIAYIWPHIVLGFKS